jgi:exodeoxyribonuclease VII large subunit
LPVITGIGHDKDLSVTDIVAHRSLKTPTAVADFLIECMINAENNLTDLGSEIADKSRLMIEVSKRRIETARSRIIPVARNLLLINGNTINRKKEILASDAKNLLGLLINRVAGFDNSLKILDPANVLKRGYTITSLNGKIIKECNVLRKDDIIDTRFSDGLINSKVL